MRVWARCGLLAALGSAMAAACFGQSLADAARQEQARKSAAPQPQHVYTNEDFPSHAPDTAAAENQPTPAETKPDSGKGAKKPSAVELRAKILAQKQKVRALEARIAEIQKRLDERESIGTVTVGQRVSLQGSYNPGPGLCYVPGMAYNPYQDWCEEPAKLTAEQKKKQAELDQERAVLEQMQEEARRLGYRSAVYDPD